MVREACHSFRLSFRNAQYALNNDFLANCKDRVAKFVHNATLPVCSRNWAQLHFFFFRFINEHLVVNVVLDVLSHCAQWVHRTDTWGFKEKENHAVVLRLSVSSRTSATRERRLPKANQSMDRIDRYPPMNSFSSSAAIAVAPGLWRCLSLKPLWRSVKMRCHSVYSLLKFQPVLTLHIVVVHSLKCKVAIRPASTLSERVLI